MASDIGAGLRQRYRDCLAQPCRGPGHQRHLSIEFELIENHLFERKSSRKGLNTSIRTTSSSIIVAPCRQFEGNCKTSPGEQMRSSPSTKKRTRPLTTIDICSCGCRCCGVSR